MFDNQIPNKTLNVHKHREPPKKKTRHTKNQPEKTTKAKQPKNKNSQKWLSTPKNEQHKINHRILFENEYVKIHKYCYYVYSLLRFVTYFSPLLFFCVCASLSWYNASRSKTYWFIFHFCFLSNRCLNED